MILYAPECSMVNHKLNFKSRGKLLHANTAFFVVILGFFSGQYSNVARVAGLLQTTSPKNNI